MLFRSDKIFSTLFVGIINVLNANRNAYATHHRHRTGQQQQPAASNQLPNESCVCSTNIMDQFSVSSLQYKSQFLCVSATYVRRHGIRYHFIFARSLCRSAEDNNSKQWCVNSNSHASINFFLNSERKRREKCNVIANCTIRAASSPYHLVVECVWDTRKWNRRLSKINKISQNIRRVESIYRVLRAMPIHYRLSTPGALFNCERVVSSHFHSRANFTFHRLIYRALKSQRNVMANPN